MGDVKFGKKIDLGMTWFFCRKEAKEGVKGYPVLHFWSLWKGRNQRAVESKGMLDQIIKSSFLGNLLLWVRMYVDGVSLTMIDFIDWLRTS